MQTTSNLGLKKPEANDTVNIADLNYNADVIDQEIVKRIINAGGVPSIQAGTAASMPAAGTAGRIYIATDTQVVYIDTGTTWQKIGVVKWADVDGKPSTFTPSPHKGTHASGGSDPLTPADIGAVANTGNGTITGGYLTLSQALGGANKIFYRAQATDGKTYDFIITTAGELGVYNRTDAKWVLIIGPTGAKAVDVFQVAGNGGALDLIGSDQFYIEFYPRGTSAGRKAYIGFPSAGSTVLTIAQEDAGNVNIAIPSGYDLFVNGSNRIRHEGNYNKFSYVAVYRNTALSLSASTWTKIICNAESVDYLGEHDTSTGRFTASRAGVYMVSWRVTFDAPPAGNQYQSAIYKNGTRLAMGNTGVTPGGYSVASVGCVPVPMVAGDYIELYAITGPNGPVDIKYGALTETSLWVARIG